MFGLECMSTLNVYAWSVWRLGIKSGSYVIAVNSLNC